MGAKLFSLALVLAIAGCDRVVVVDNEPFDVDTGKPIRGVRVEYEKVTWSWGDNTRASSWIAPDPASGLYHVTIHEGDDVTVDANRYWKSSVRNNDGRSELKAPDLNLIESMLMIAQQMRPQGPRFEIQHIVDWGPIDPPHIRVPLYPIIKIE